MAELGEIGGKKYRIKVTTTNLQILTGQEGLVVVMWCLASPGSVTVTADKVTSCLSWTWTDLAIVTKRRCHNT